MPELSEQETRHTAAMMELFLLLREMRFESDPRLPFQLPNGLWVQVLPPMDQTMRIKLGETPDTLISVDYDIRLSLEGTLESFGYDVSSELWPGLVDRTLDLLAQHMGVVIE